MSWTDEELANLHSVVKQKFWPVVVERSTLHIIPVEAATQEEATQLVQAEVDDFIGEVESSEVLSFNYHVDSPGAWESNEYREAMRKVKKLNDII